MIVTEEKPLEEVLEFLAPYNRILVVGCQGCFQPPRGLKEAQGYLPKLEAEGKVVRAATAARQCDLKIVTSKLEEQLGDSEAILSLGCGVGVQVLSEVFPQIPTYPAQNTMFIGGEGPEGKLRELCSACGDCVLDETGGICPVTRCAKSMFNGPCGGSEGGRCEVDPQLECAWHLICNRLKALGRLKSLDEVWSVRDWSNSGFGGPRSIRPASER